MNSGYTSAVYKEIFVTRDDFRQWIEKFHQIILQFNVQCTLYSIWFAIIEQQRSHYWQQGISILLEQENITIGLRKTGTMSSCWARYVVLSDRWLSLCIEETAWNSTESVCQQCFMEAGGHYNGLENVLLVYTRTTSKTGISLIILLIGHYV